MRRAIAAFRHAHQELQTSSTASSSRGLPLTAAALASRAAVTAGRGQERVRAYLAAILEMITVPLISRIFEEIPVHDLIVRQIGIIITFDYFFITGLAHVSPVVEDQRSITLS